MQVVVRIAQLLYFTQTRAAIPSIDYAHMDGFGKRSSERTPRGSALTAGRERHRCGRIRGRCDACPFNAASPGQRILRPSDASEAVDAATIVHAEQSLPTHQGT